MQLIVGVARGNRTGEVGVVSGDNTEDEGETVDPVEWEGGRVENPSSITIRECRELCMATIGQERTS